MPGSHSAISQLVLVARCPSRPLIFGCSSFARIHALPVRPLASLSLETPALCTPAHQFPAYPPASSWLSHPLVPLSIACSRLARRPLAPFVPARPLTCTPGCSFFAFLLHFAHASETDTVFDPCLCCLINYKQGKNHEACVCVK